MHHAIRKTTALFAVLGAIGLAHAEGAPGDAGVGAPDGSSSAVSGHGMTRAKKTSHKANAAAKRSNAASGAKADGPMSNSTVGKGG